KESAQTRRAHAGGQQRQNFQQPFGDFWRVALTRSFHEAARHVRRRLRCDLLENLASGVRILTAEIDELARGGDPIGILGLRVLNLSEKRGSDLRRVLLQYLAVPSR